MLDDPGVVACRKGVCAGAVCERQQPGETKAAVAMDARVGCLAALVAAHERLDHGAPKLVAQVERHVRHAERVTGRASREDCVGRAASTLSVRPVGIEPEAQSNADRVRQRLEQRHRAVDTAAHRNSHAPSSPRRTKNGPDRVGERIDGKRLPTNRSSLQQRQPNKRTIEPRSISLNNPLTVKTKPHKRELRPRAESPMSSITNSG